MIIIKILCILVAILILAGFVLFAGFVCFLFLEKYGELDDDDIYHDDIQD